MRHLLGALGVLAAGVLLAVSAAMNWRFGVYLGRTEFDGQIYGAASAAADCFKALIPFFFFAAIKNRMWSQAIASAVVWVVVTSYSMTSALGHAALNRTDTTGTRAAQAQTYKDMQADKKRAQDQWSGIPQHRPIKAVQAEIDGVQNQKAWDWTKGCTDVTSKSDRGYCQKFHALSAELANARQAQELDTRIAGLESKIAGMPAAATMAESDPQAAVLAKLAALAFPNLNLKIEDVQTAMAVFIALLLEIGSGFGMYVAFSQWRLYDRQAPAAPRMATVSSSLNTHSGSGAAAVAVAAPVALPQPAVAIAKPRSGANDNSTSSNRVEKAPAAPRMIAPETDVERFYKERIETQDGSSLTATSLYEDYCAWCEDREKEPLALPTFGREFGDLGVQKAKIAGRVRYIGIALRSGLELAEDKNQPAFRVRAA